MLHLRTDRLIALRKKNKLSQQELAIKVGVSLHSVFRWEKGLRTPDAEKLALVADILGVSIEYLLDKTDTLQEPKDHEKGPTSEEIGPSVDIVLPSGRTIALTPGQLRAYENWQKDRDLDKTLALAATLGIPLSDMIPGENRSDHPSKSHRDLALLVRTLAREKGDADPESSALASIETLTEDDARHILDVVKETLLWKLRQTRP
ncbi:helix-turn-helix domain-containing protein [Aminirod propionatiphilus]|uniref:Helix-turn-helix domain-containing protein n=1 Tax=Aminirod propionatiphilus TaxID=3415223 RepID=A0ACD1DU71_9BACT|nr:helix-turn-helix domain-containing protein [Synergistota bacterium]